MYCLEEQKIITVKDMFDFASDTLVPLLGSYQLVTYDFWSEYMSNFEEYDKLFCTMYKNFFYFDQDGTEPVDDVFERFCDSVNGLLMMNRKKYAELYKIELLTIDGSSILSDYKITEEKENERGVEREYVSGERQDTGEDVSGQRTDVETNQVMAFNSTEFVDSTKTTDQKGSETDTTEYNKGEQTDTENVSETGSHTITTTGTKGNPYENMTKYMEAWDSYSFYRKIFNDIAAEFLLL